MRPERIVVFLALSLWAAGFVVWGIGGASLLRSLGIWLWLGALGVLSLPLLLWLIDAVVRAVRR